eukprot:CAMPEP_0168815646 /NCGR_PEP_ID=MMETSP0726-20121227/6312_1 /TAXON_ID=265536 /ORGANISM="Amphiprora sp., Strain CCMP467" /LENGTH=393 /DNA_ID=CAMNT_0008867875 /DNA_START=1 /DNA_END=1182 /DNA_ORIENTATION=+
MDHSEKERQKEQQKDTLRDAQGRRVVLLQKYDKNFLSGLMERTNHARNHHHRAFPRPNVDTGWVEPVLSGFAHVVWEHESNSTSTPCRIFLGSSQSGTQSIEVLAAEGIGGIVNCTKMIPCHHRTHGIKYCQVAINDVAAADLITYLPGGTKFIRAALQELKVSVLVHCMAGVSRSASVVLAYLIEYEEMTLQEAYVHVKQLRPLIFPNDGFFAQLLLYEKRCQRNRIRKKDNNNNNKDEITVNHRLLTDTIDKEWAKQSTALYGACRDMEVANGDFLDECFGELQSRPWSKEERVQILTVVLDFIWGRGVLQVEIDWLAEICKALDKWRDINGDHVGITASNQVQDILSNPESQFCSTWAGEIYQPQINRVLETIGASCTPCCRRDTPKNVS